MPDRELQPMHSPSAFNNSGSPRACDQCRLRKIRCDKQSPCSNCRIANRACSSNGLGQKPREARQRVLISSQYERKIDQIETRLGGIEKTLQELVRCVKPNDRSPAAAAAAAAAVAAVAATVDKGSVGSLRSQTGSSSMCAVVDGKGEGGVNDDDYDDDEDDDSAFEGESSMAAQTAFASEFLEVAVTRSSLRELSPDMRSALALLRRIFCMGSRKCATFESSFANQKPLPKGGVRELPQLPKSLIESILCEIKASPPVTFTLIWAFFTVENFTECCRRVFFTSGDYSMATFIVVYTGLYYLFQEKSMASSHIGRARTAELLQCQNLCRDNLETALANLPLLMPARMGNIEALLLGATYAVETSKFTLAWQLNTAAVMMCQTLGYHRRPLVALVGDEALADFERKSALFWVAYMLDKGLALRFGRASVVHDFDISLPRELGASINVSDPWKMVLNLWIRHAELMGRVYDQLYSPAALGRPPEQRISSARHLVDAVEKLMRDSDELGQRVRPSFFPRGDDPGPDATNNVAYTIDMVLRADRVTYLSSLTLIYRAISPLTASSRSRTANTTFSSECVDAARRAFACHAECMQLTGRSLSLKASYLHWTILYAPFIPFVVLFCHVIETSEGQDLRRLADFVASLQPIGTISQAIDTLHRVCSVLYNVASQYVEAKAQQQQQQQQHHQHYQHVEDRDLDIMYSGEFDLYLGMLGFMPQADNNNLSVVTLGAGAGAADSNINNGMMAGNNEISQILDRIEQDQSDFNPGVWSSIIGGP